MTSNLPTSTTGDHALTERDHSRVITFATRAPSVHNTQPWRFTWGPGTLDVYADRDRALPVLDPDGRQMIISCGAALQHAVLALHTMGRATSVTYLPDAADPDHLAHIAIGPAIAPTAADLALVAAAPHRRTRREPFAERPLPVALLDQLRRGVAAEGSPEGVWLHPIVHPEQLVATEVLLSHADAAQRQDPAYLAELAQWRRHDEAGETGDGIIDAAVADTRHRGSSVPLRDFDAGAAPRPSGPVADPPPAEHPQLVVLGTDGDDAVAWLAAGRALGWLLLRATAAGVAASPLNQVLDAPGWRRRYAHSMGLLGHPQMLLRLGYVEEGEAGPTTPRRSVDEVVGSSGGEEDTS